MLSFGPVGPEFLVNTKTSDSQHSASVAMDATGNFVVARASVGPASPSAIFARRYDASGQPLGGEIAVSTGTLGQEAPAVAMDASGDFVVAWAALAADSTVDISARRFNSADQPLGDAFAVNEGSTATWDYDWDPAVAMDADGDFVIAWSGYLYARRYGAAGLPQGGEFPVAEASFHQMEPSVAIDADGDFTVAWSHGMRWGGYTDLLDPDVRVRRYDAAGQAAGGAVVVADDATAPAVSVDSDGDCVVAWQNTLDTSVSARRFGPTGAPVGDRVDVSASGTTASVALSGNREFVVAWHSPAADSTGGDVHARRFCAAGEPLGGEFRVNTFAADAEVAPSVAIDGAGGFVVAWHSYGQDGSGAGVYGQRFGEGGVPPPPPPPSISVNDVAVTEGNSGTVNAVFTVSLSSASGDAVTVNYATADGDAFAGSDYVGAAGTLAFAPGETIKTVAVAVRGDLVDEFDQRFTLDLSGAVNVRLADAQGSATVIEDDASPAVTIGDVFINEGRGRTSEFAFIVSLSAASEKTVRVSFSTANGTATLADDDYEALSGTLVLAPGETTKTIAVLVVGDKRREANEFFLVNLFNVSNAVLGDAQGRGTVLNDD